uniref:ubiquitinyl hydrolase 1 n=3 Tax=Rhodosorus marinus TaxID=101924 RepID=A0A7S3EKM0_9RHOD|mmetsp:Transcript_43878/g.171523  ORF Transcript_43878/g.171523 Transcript_43878/m.171523 type:complete len:838 (+) Transcript_43878:23-2536(+)
MVEGEDMEDGMMSSRSPTRMEEYRAFQEAQKRASGKLKIGDQFYLLDSMWYRKWEEAARNGENGRREPVDNYGLLGDSNELGEDLQENVDFIIVGPEAWRLLLEWYDGGPELRREVIFNGIENVIEIYKLNLKIKFQGGFLTKRNVSKSWTLDELKAKIFVEYPSLNSEDYDVFFYNSSTRIPGSLTLHQGQITSESTLQIQPRNGLNGFRDNDDDSLQPTLEDYKNNKHSGLTGLQNLGFTCFMNSALQCLSNTVSLSEFFLSGKYEKEINEDNPIGRQGNLARAYATVLRHIWRAEERSYAPRSLKFQLGHYAPQFHGYTQQDAQELMAFLMDGLHEDLNRIRNKPVVEAVEGGSEPDDLVAEKAWKNHKLRNDSIIVDLFHGQYKSTVICPTCEKVSVTFDPFMYLTLPLPARLEKTIEVTFVPLPIPNGGKQTPIKYAMKYFPNTTKIGDLKSYVAEKTGRNPSKLVIAVKLIYNRLDSRMAFLDNDALKEEFSQLTIMAYEVTEEVSAITGSAYNSIVDDVETEDDEEDKLIMVEILQSFSGEEIRHVTMPQLFTVRRSQCTGRRVAREVLDRVTNYFDFEEFEKSATDEGELDRPFELKFAKKALHIAYTAVKEEVDPESDEVLDAARTCSKTTVFVEWNSATEAFSDCWNYEDSLGMNFVEDESINRLKNETQEVTLDECIKFWEKEETLTEQNAWYCPKCQEHKLASKSLQMWRMPEFLVIHLKRFSYTTWNRNKVDVFVDFPLTGLDMKPFLPPGSAFQENVYDLYAVSNHMGGLGGGHYTAYAISPWKDQQWYAFDDSIVTEMNSASSVKSSSAYVLFYRRRQPDTM